MNRRDFLKQSASALGALATISMLEIPLMAYGMNMTGNEKKQKDIKKIIIIDGGPRRDMNTAQMLQKFAEGANLPADTLKSRQSVCTTWTIKDAYHAWPAN